MELRFVNTTRRRDLRRRFKGVMIGREEIYWRAERWVELREILGWKGTRIVICFGTLYP